eukprot:TRINITY_DN13601_c0_g1_i2.p1 TRINITY_DN13601_c0_g1~~TRINITY_DN13601_c0_g1_i2.p1  ORF type:complete len:524 (+),score=57.83 TRINITY_DN13601_c0_g1_i2:1-1572(+)
MAVVPTQLESFRSVDQLEETEERLLELVFQNQQGIVSDATRFQEQHRGVEIVVTPFKILAVTQSLPNGLDVSSARNVTFASHDLTTVEVVEDGTTHDKEGAPFSVIFEISNTPTKRTKSISVPVAPATRTSPDVSRRGVINRLTNAPTSFTTTTPAPAISTPIIGIESKDTRSRSRSPPRRSITALLDDLSGNASRSTSPAPATTTSPAPVTTTAHTTTATVAATATATSAPATATVKPTSSAAAFFEGPTLTDLALQLGQKVSVVRSNFYVPQSVVSYYFEITILNPGAPLTFTTSSTSSSSSSSSTSTSTDSSSTTSTASTATTTTTTTTTSTTSTTSTISTTSSLSISTTPSTSTATSSPLSPTSPTSPSAVLSPKDFAFDIAIGMYQEGMALEGYPGYNSFAFSTRRGEVHYSHNTDVMRRLFGEACGKAGDVIGCGYHIKFNKRSVFFTLNGKKIGSPIERQSMHGSFPQMHPAAWLQCKGGKLKFNFGQEPWMFNFEEIGRAVQQECRDRSRMPSSA